MLSRFRHVLLLALTVPCPAAPLRVATLSPILTEIAKAVGGREVSVTGILAPGVDPHTFEPAPADLAAITGADIVLASGLGLESYLDRIAANSGAARIAAAGPVLGRSAIAAASGGRAEADPHWWNSVSAMITVTGWVADEFAALRPDGAAGFRARAASYVARLRALDAWARRALAAIPPDRRDLVTTHSAFGWFARDYGFSARAIEGISTESEPDARSFAALADTVRSRRIPVIFPESGENTKLAASLARESGARLGEPLYADGLAAEPEGENYEAMFRHNIQAIVAGLR